MLRKYVIYGKDFVCQVDVNSNNVIVATCPLLRKFLGDKLSNLLSWRAIETYEQI